MGLDDIYKNRCVLTDVYNLGHWLMKCNMDWETSHIYNRNRSMILFGFWETVIKTLNTRITNEMIDNADRYAVEMNMPFPRKMFERVVDKLNGVIPLHVEALPEGTYVPKGTPFAQISNTVKGFGELVTWFEPMFVHSYFPSGCATVAFEIRDYLDKYRYRTSKIHSFGFRGHSSLESAYWAGMAWCLFLTGTDDFHVKQHLPPNVQISSINAMAHKVIQQFDREIDAYKFAISNIADKKRKGWRMLSLVIDTYDAWQFINKYMAEVVRFALDNRVHLVLRPDSGDTLEQGKAILKYKAAINEEHLSCIIGEDMDFDKVKYFDNELSKAGFDPNDMTYGIGAGYYDNVNRNFLGFSMKTAYSNGKPRMKFSASGKMSIPGRVRLAYEGNRRMKVYLYEFTRDKDVVHTLYETTYFYDPSVPDDKPVMVHPDYEQTWNRAQMSLNAADEYRQDKIIISTEILDLMASIKHKYLPIAA
jgi:nicotinamide phosphoribosyltransferase